MASTEVGSRGLPRSKRSSTNLANLRLAPLSARFEESSVKAQSNPRSPYDETREFSRNHSSYLQGKSTPTTPGILSRSSSRRHLAGGISRRGSLYDNEGVTYEYAVAAGAGGEVERAEVGSGQIPKAKSEAALDLTRASGVSMKDASRKRHHYRSGTGGSTTSRGKGRTKASEDDWVTRTGAATNALVQESKGQSWLATKESSAAIVPASETTDEEDEGYEEMAALSAMTIRLPPTSGEISPVGTRASRWGSRYGSRYGSRATSRRTSRRGSVSGLRTPLAPLSGPEAMTSYFDGPSRNFDQESVNDDFSEDDSADEREVSLLASTPAPFGLSGLVDQIMNFSLFNVFEERDETSADDDIPVPPESEAQAKARMNAENRRRKEEKLRLVALPAPVNEVEGAEQNDVGWHDAAWLLSVATRAMFSDTDR